VKWNRNCDGRRLHPFLHDLVTTALAHSGESIMIEDAQASEPERTRSLPNRYFNLSYEDFVVSASGDFRF
jgi:hypothetical protein